MGLPNYGEGVRLHSITPHVGDDRGWITVETVFIQLDTSLTPSGRFPAYWNVSFPAPGPDKELKVGYDVAVCVQKYEPWIIKAYNTSTGSSFLLGVVGKGDGSTSQSPSGDIRGARIANPRYLSATGKDSLFSIVHGYGVIRFSEANKNDDTYCVPTPTVGPIVPRIQHPF